MKNQFFPQSIPHPGETLQEKLEEMNMGPKEFALRTGKPEKTITAILNGESSITADMAVQFENVTRIPANFWATRQMNYDEYLAREKRKPVIDAAMEWADLFPVADMIRQKWLPAAVSPQEQAAALLSFFGFSGHKVWGNYYFNQQLKVSFRISLVKVNEPYSISAWLRQGELQAALLDANEYSEKEFKKLLPDLQKLMVKCSVSFFKELQGLCLKSGVKVVHTPCLPKAPINGSTRWMSNTPLIQLSDNYNNDESFWFTFFHEAGHILLHGKKDIFLEKVKYSENDEIKEQEADAFASKWMNSTAVE